VAGKRQKVTSSTEREALDNVERTEGRRWHNSAVLTRSICGHVGRENNAPSAKAKAWIRVAEIRGSLVEDETKKCGDCK
jgi:hypothetical protein